MTDAVVSAEAARTLPPDDLQAQAKGACEVL